MKPAESPSALKVQAALGERFEVLEFDASTRTAADAAAAIGCEVAQIAKSLIFRGATSGRAVLIIASGVDRVDENKAAAAIGEPIARTPILCARRRASPSGACRRSATRISRSFSSRNRCSASTKSGRPPARRTRSFV